MATAKQKAWQHKFSRAAKACKVSKGKTARAACMRKHLKKK